MTVWLVVGREDGSSSNLSHPSIFSHRDCVFVCTVLLFSQRDWIFYLSFLLLNTAKKSAPAHFLEDEYFFIIIRNLFFSSAFCKKQWVYSESKYTSEDGSPTTRAIYSVLFLLLLFLKPQEHITMAKEKKNKWKKKYRAESFALPKHWRNLGLPVMTNRRVTDEQECF